MIFWARDNGRKLEVRTKDGIVVRELSKAVDVTLWDGRGLGKRFHGEISIFSDSMAFRGTAKDLMFRHQLTVIVDGVNAIDL